METISKNCLIYSDCNYNHAVNYQHMYNAPITLNFGEKHNRSKYIISSGTCDSITLVKDGIYIYVISENTGLNYIGMDCINTESKEVEGHVFLSDNDLNDEDNFCYGILDLTPLEQVKILSEYLS
jgi:hypothetical protein